jgi:hypothetical protein
MKIPKKGLYLHHISTVAKNHLQIGAEPYLKNRHKSNVTQTRSNVQYVIGITNQRVLDPLHKKASYFYCRLTSLSSCLAGKCQFEN